MTITITNGMAASLVLGQSNFTSNARNTSQNGLASPRHLAVDPTTGKVFVVDTGNHRVLRYASTLALASGAAAEAVFGQSNFTSSGGATSPNGMIEPHCASVDSAGRLWVADSNNHRVLRFDYASSKLSGANADGVLGQPGFSSNGPGTGQNSMWLPRGVFADSAGRVWVAEYENNRILRFDNAASKPNGSMADGVLGQPNFGTRGFPPASASSFNLPMYLHVDLAGRLWVADHNYKRVLRFDNAASKPNGASADGVLGQPGFSSSGTGISQNTYQSARGMTYDDVNNVLYVFDYENHRVMVYTNAPSKANGAPADNVIGQSGFNSNAYGLTNSLLNGPWSGFFDSKSQVLWVADAGNNRVLMFGIPSAVSPTTASTTNTPAAEVWLRVANEGQSFFIPNTQTIRYGINDKWVIRTLAGNIAVNNSFFGADPAPGIAKACEIQVNSAATPSGTWLRVANEGQSFFIPSIQTVRYGINDKWVTRTLSGNVDANSSFFGNDPAPGIVKACEILAVPPSATTTASNLGNALDFDGVNDYVRIPNPFTGFTNQITVEAWIYFDGGGDGIWMGQSASNVDAMSTNVWLWHSAGMNSLTWYINNGGGWLALTMPSVSNGWHHIATAASNTGMQIYIDGILATSNGSVLSNLQNVPTAIMDIGKDPRFDTSSGRVASQKVDELRVWNVARSQTQVRDNMNKEVSPQAGLVAYYRFNQGVANGSNAGLTTLTDDSGNARHGTLVNFALNGSTSNWTTGIVQSAIIDTIAPKVEAFLATTPSPTLTIPITSFKASDNVAVTGYKITTVATPPTASEGGWTASAPTTFAVAAPGSYMLYPWVKDAAGNISAVFGSPVSVTVQDTTAPTVTAFTIPSASPSLNISITAFSATDNVAVTGYKITNSPTLPTASDAGWSTTPPTTFTVPNEGTYSLYPWAKDSAGNVSAVFNTPAQVVADLTLPTVTGFTVSSLSTTLAIPITKFVALDNVMVAGYKITTSATPPATSDAGWSASAPASFNASAYGTYTLYPWVKDAAGNVSALYGNSAQVTVVDVVPPVVNSFQVTSPASTLIFNIRDFSASDNVAVTAYLITLSSTPPQASNPGWSSTKPTTYAVSKAGTYTLYPWAKDAAGNVSTLFGSPVSAVALDNPPSIPLTNGMIASLVLGQPNFSSNIQAVSDTGMWSADSVAIDPISGKLFVVDGGETRRILRFASLSALKNGSPAEAVFVQPDFTSAQHPGGDVTSLCVDSRGRLWVGWWGSEGIRILRFDNAASLPSGTRMSSYNGYLTVNGLEKIFVDSTGRLWVTTGNVGQILRFDNAASKPNGSANPDGILGLPNSGGRFMGGGPFSPSGICGDAAGRIWISEPSNHRVLRFDNAAGKPNYAQADNVLGYPQFDDSIEIKPATSQSRFYGPRGLALDESTGTLFVADLNNLRVLGFINAAAKPNGANADLVLSQKDFTSGWYRGSEGDQVSDTRVHPRGLFYDPLAKALWVAGDARVVAFGVNMGFVRPAVAQFTVPATVTISIPITVLKAADNVKVAGYKITTSPTPLPSPSDLGWSATPPQSLAPDHTGGYQLYPWVKDTDGNVSPVFSNPASVNLVADPTAPKVYVANDGGMRVSAPDGSGKIRIGSFRPDGMAVDYRNKKIYYTSGGGVYRVNLDGTEDGRIGGNWGGVNGIALDLTNNRFYVVDGVANKILRANLDGSDIKDYGNPGGMLDNPRDIAVDASRGKIYIVSNRNSKVISANLDGSNPQDFGDLNHAFLNPSGIVVDNIAGKMYIAGSASIVRANLDGSGVEILAGLSSMLSGAFDIALDMPGKKLYVANYNNTIIKANLDGTGAVNLGDLGGYLIATTPTPGPIVATGAATSMTASGVTVNGVVNPNESNVTRILIEYGPTANYGSYVDTNQSIANGSIDKLISMHVDGLTAATTYHYRIIANWFDPSILSERPTYGNDQTFTTLADTKPPKLYVVNHGNSGLLVSNLDGSGGSRIGSISPSGGVAIDPVASKAYYTSGGSVWRMNLDGTGEQNLGNPGNFLSQGFGIDLDLTNSKMYIVDASNHKVIRANLDGSNAQDLGTLGLLNGPRDIALDVPNNKMYILSIGNSKVVKANLDGTNPQDLGNLSGTVVDASGIALDPTARRMYVSTKTAVIWANLDGTGIKNLGSLNNTLNTGFGIAVDARAGKVYVSNFGDSTISQANLNGTGGVKLGNPNGLLSMPYGIAVNCDPNQVPVDSIQYQPAGQWFRVASEGQSCTIPSAQTYRYGAGDYWVVKQRSGQVVCDSSFTNVDPTPGQAKFLEIEISNALVKDATGSWLPIVWQDGQEFSFPTEQRFRYRWDINLIWKEKLITGIGRGSVEFFGYQNPRPNAPLLFSLSHDYLAELPAQGVRREISQKLHDHFQAYLPSSGIDIVGGANEWLIGDHIAFSSLYRITKEGETLNVYLANAVYCQLCIERAPLPPEAPPVPSPFSLDLRGSAIAPEVGTPTFVMINGKLLERFGVEHGPGLNTYIIKPSGSTRAFNSHNVYHTLTGVEQWNAWAEFIDNFSAPGDIIAVVSSESIYNAPLQGKATDLLKAVGATISFDAMRGIPPKRTAYALVFIRGKTTCYETVAWDGKNAEIQVKVDINAQTLTTVYLTPRTEPELESVSPVNQPASTDSSITQPSNNLYFDGRYNYIRCDLKEPDTGVTHELWFKTSHPGAGILSVTKGDIDSNQGYDRLIYLENGQLRAELAQMDIAQPQNRVVDVIQSSTGAPLADDAWHHVAHVFSGSEQKLYLDGQLIGSSAKRGTSMFSWHDALLIGYCFNASAPYFSGQISDVRVWNKARQQSEIQAGMSSRLRGNEPGLIGYWPLDGDVRNYADNPSVISAGFNAGELIGPEDWQPWRDNEVLKPLTESVLSPLSAPALTAAFTWFKDQAKTKDINTLIQTPSSFGYPLPPALRGLLANRLLSFGEASISNVVYEIVDGVPGEISVNPVDIEEPRPENKRLRVSGLVSYASRFGAMNARTEYLEVFQYRGKPGASIKFKLNEPVNLGAWLDGVSLLAGIPLKDVGLIISDPQVILSTMDVKDMEKEEGTVPVTPSEKEEEGREVNKGFNLFGKIDLKNSPNSIMRNVGTIVRTEKIDVHAAIKTESTPSEYVLSGEVEYDPPHVFNYRDQIEVFLKGTELTLSSVGQENSVEVGATAQVIINEERLALLKLPGMQLQKRTFDIVGGISFEPGQISGKFTAKPEQEWSNPFGVERVTIRKASAVLGYTGPALTSVGVAGDISLNNAPGVFETLVDLTNPQSIIFACKFDQLTLFDVMAVYYSKYYPLYEKLPGGLQNVLDRIVKKVSMQNVDILFAPEDGEIGEEKIEQGMAAKGDLDIWGWKSRLALKVDFDSGILDAGATLGSISLANIVKVEGISPQAGPQFKLHVEPSASNPMAAEISGRLTFMGWSSTDVIIRAAEDGLAFQLAADLLVDIVKVNLRFVYREDSSITADGALAVALNVDIPVGIGTLNLRAGLIAQLGIDATLNSYKAVVKGEFMFMDRKITFPELTLTNAPATASALVKEIEKQLISIAASLFADLFKTLTDLARALAEKLIELAFTLANIGVQVFHETVENIAQAYKDAKKIAGEAASEIKGVFTDLNPDQMADLLCGVAYSMDDVKNALVDTFKISPEEAFGKATAAAQKVLDSVLKGEIDAKKTADELAKEVEKRVPGASGKMIALGFRNAGVSANMVINVYGKVFGAFKDAMPAEIQAALEAVGYVRNEILGAFKTAGGALAKYAEDVWDTLNPTKW